MVNGAVTPTTAYVKNSNDFRELISAKESRKIEEATRKYNSTVNLCSSEDERKPPARPERQQKKRSNPQQVPLPAKWPFSNPETTSQLYTQIVDRNEQDKRMDMDKEDLSKGGKEV